jgi:hypothetical protein
MGAPQRPAVRRAMQRSQESLRVLAKRNGVNPKAIAKRRSRMSIADLPTGLKKARSPVLSVEEEAVIVAFRKDTLMPLDGCLCSAADKSRISRWSPHRCLGTMGYHGCRSARAKLRLSGSSGSNRPATPR